jgi:hypothetical protein
MNPHEQFLTEEFFRYSAECRRLARLARRPPGTEHDTGRLVHLRFVEWLGELQGRYTDPAPARLAHR